MLFRQAEASIVAPLQFGRVNLWRRQRCNITAWVILYKLLRVWGLWKKVPFSMGKSHTPRRRRKLLSLHKFALSADSTYIMYVEWRKGAVFLVTWLKDVLLVCWGPFVLKQHRMKWNKTRFYSQFNVFISFISQWGTFF